jgi:hypothetical protein
MEILVSYTLTLQNTVKMHRLFRIGLQTASSSLKFAHLKTQSADASSSSSFLFVPRFSLEGSPTSATSPSVQTVKIRIRKDTVGLPIDDRVMIIIPMVSSKSSSSESSTSSSS